MLYENLFKYFNSLGFADVSFIFTQIYCNTDLSSGRHKTIVIGLRLYKT